MKHQRKTKERNGRNVVKKAIKVKNTLNDKIISFISEIQMNDPIYQLLRTGRIWHKVNF